MIVIHKLILEGSNSIVDCCNEIYSEIENYIKFCIIS